LLKLHEVGIKQGALIDFLKAHLKQPLLVNPAQSQDSQ